MATERKRKDFSTGKLTRKPQIDELKSFLQAYFENTDLPAGNRQFSSPVELIACFYNLFSSNLVILDAYSNICFASKSFSDEIAISSKSLETMKFDEIITPFEREEFTEFLSVLDRMTGELSRMKLKLIVAKHEIQFRVEGRSLNLGADNHFFVLYFTKEVFEQQYKNENIRLHNIIEHCPLSVIITDVLGYIEYVNTQFEKVTGYKKEEVISKKTSVLKSGLTPPETYRELWRTISEGKTWRGEIQNKKKSGELYWDMVFISPILNAEGKVCNYFAINEDITIRKIIFEQLSEDEERIRFIYEATGDVLYKYNQITSKYAYINPTIEKMTGYTGEEISKIRLSSIILQVEIAEDVFISKEGGVEKKVYGPRGEYRAEYQIRTKSGQTKWIEDHSFPWFDKAGIMIGSAGILSDISERKDIEIELRKAKSDAESMNRLKNTFLANMSHELRTPMISIIGYSDILRDKIADEETQELAGIINQSAVRLTDTLNLILDLSSLESEQMPLQFSNINLIDLINKEITKYREQAGKKHLAFSILFPPKDRILVQADYHMLKQVLVNLVSNAIKYTTQGSVGVQVEQKDGEVLIAVSDTGIGIKKEHFDLIFEEFRQVSEGLGRKYEGTGLGLNISKRFIEKMNGKIWVESEYGKGSIFYITLRSSK